MRANPSYIESLTPLRGIAAVFVVVFHYNSFLLFMGLPVLSNGSRSGLLVQSYFWVDFFFVLSGFIITHVYAEALLSKEKGRVQKYLWARFTRLYPLHLFVMLLTAGWALGLKALWPDYYTQNWAQFFPMDEFLKYLGFGVSFGLVREYSWNLPAWSIAAEWWAYVAAIGLVPWLHRGSIKRTVAVGVGMLAFVAALNYYGALFKLDLALDLGLLRCISEFTIGIGIYQLYRKWRHGQTILESDGFFAAAALGSLLALHFKAPPLIIVVSFALLILCAALNSGIPQRLLNSRPLRVLGDISYSIYLLQMLWLCSWNVWFDLHWKVAHPDRSPTAPELYLWLALALCGIIGSAFLSYHFVEIASRRKLRSLLAS